MKKHFYLLIAFAFVTSIAFAQDAAPKAKTNKQKNSVTIEKSEKDVDGKKEITIKKNTDGKTETTTVVIDGENVTVNGKPIEELKGVFNNLGNMKMNLNGMNFGRGNMALAYAPKLKALRNKLQGMHGMGGNKAMLGVVTEGGDNGAKITEITKESAAEKAGLKEGDIITKINDEKIAGSNELIKSIGKYKPEENVDVTILRDGKEKRFKATLGKNDGEGFGNFNFNFNDELNIPEIPNMPETFDGTTFPHNFNFDFNGDNEKIVNKFAKPKFGFSIKDNENGEGAVITKVSDESVAAKAGLLANDIVTEADGNAIKTTDDLKAQLKNTEGKTSINLKVLRNGKTENIQVNIPKKIKTADL